MIVVVAAGCWCCCCCCCSRGKSKVMPIYPPLCAVSLVHGGGGRNCFALRANADVYSIKSSACSPSLVMEKYYIHKWCVQDDATLFSSSQDNLALAFRKFIYCKPKWASRFALTPHTHTYCIYFIPYGQPFLCCCLFVSSYSQQTPSRASSCVSPHDEYGCT